jgi:hypothetical protein
VAIHDQRAYLRLETIGGIELGVFADALDALDGAYAAMLAYYVTMQAIGAAAERSLNEGGAISAQGATLASFPISWQTLPASERLFLSGAQIGSPGFLEFLGSLNPLEQLRRYLNERWERTKDREYRNAEENRRLVLENDRVELDNLAQFVEVARAAGATDEDLAGVRARILEAPLRRLGAVQDMGLVGRAEIADAPTLAQIAAHA